MKKIYRATFYITGEASELDAVLPQCLESCRAKLVTKLDECKRATTLDLEIDSYLDDETTWEQKS